MKNNMCQHGIRGQFTSKPMSCQKTEGNCSIKDMLRNSSHVRIAIILVIMAAAWTIYFCSQGRRRAHAQGNLHISREIPVKGFFVKYLQLMATWASENWVSYKRTPETHTCTCASICSVTTQTHLSYTRTVLRTVKTFLSVACRSVQDKELY
jgi:hypothetical protein